MELFCRLVWAEYKERKARGAPREKTAMPAPFPVIAAWTGAGGCKKGWNLLDAGWPRQSMYCLHNLCTYRIDLLLKNFVHPYIKVDHCSGFIQQLNGVEIFYPKEELKIIIQDCWEIRAFLFFFFLLKMMVLKPQEKLTKHFSLLSTCWLSSLEVGSLWINRDSGR